MSSKQSRAQYDSDVSSGLLEAQEHHHIAQQIARETASLGGHYSLTTRLLFAHYGLVEPGCLMHPGGPPGRSTKREQAIREMLDHQAS